MRLNILIGGKAGQGINKISEIVSKVLVSWGYFTFNYRDYPSIIRGGHNFNVLSISDEQIESYNKKIDIIVALDERTLKSHKAEMTKKTQIIKSDEFKILGRNLNVALSGVLIKALGIPFEVLEEEIRRQFKDSDLAVEAAKKGFDSGDEKYSLKKLDNKISILSGSKAIAVGAKRAGLDVYIAYPMTPSTNALHEMASDQLDHNMLVFQGENEIGVASMALGCSFTGAKTMIGTSGGGFDLMGETLSLQGMTGIPLTVYLASRPGPATGVPTYTSQADLNIALRSGHGEFPRVVVAPGNAVEQIEKVQEALFLSEKFGVLSIVLSDKHLAESEFSSTLTPKDPKPIEVKRNVPGKSIIKASSYETNSLGNSTEDPVLTRKNMDARLAKYEKLKKYVLSSLETIKIHGNEKSKNLVIGWGSTSGVIKDAINGLNVKFLQIVYAKPLSPEIKKHIEKSSKVALVEVNSTGQMGRLIREHTGVKIEDRILKYDGRPFYPEELHKKLKEVFKLK